MNITGSKPHPYEVGKIYFIRTVTMHLVGRLSAVFDQEIVLTNAAWIADSGRFSKALKDKNELQEIEPFPDGSAIVGRGSIVDAVKPEWQIELREMK